MVVNKQALINTGCPDTAFSAGEYFDQQDETRNTPRNDDSGSFAGSESSGNSQFNFSGNDQVSADGQDATGVFSLNNLQDFLGLNQNALNIATSSYKNMAYLYSDILDDDGARKSIISACEK